MVKEIFNGQMETHIMETGEIIKEMGKEFR